MSDSGVDLDPAAYGERVADVYDDWHPVAAGDPEITATLDFLQARAGTGPALELESVPGVSPCRWPHAG